MGTLMIVHRRSMCRYKSDLLIRDGKHRAIEVTFQMFIGTEMLDAAALYKLADLAHQEAVRKHWKRIVLEPSLDGLYVCAKHPCENNSGKTFRLCHFGILN